MKKIGIALLLFALICASCDEKTEEPQYSGTIQLSSELLVSGQDYVFYGFSFESAEISLYSLTSPTLPDLAAVHLLGDTITADLVSSNDMDAFHKSGTFQNAAEAEAYFNNYTEVISSDFQPLAYSVKENQVWTVQTASKKFAKIWIKEIIFQKGSISDFVELKIQYEYQPDGSRTFDCECN